VAAQEIMVSNIFPVDVDEPGPGWFPPPGGRLTERWTARSPMYLTPAGPATPDVLGTGSAAPVASHPAPAVPVRQEPAPVTEPPRRAAARAVPAGHGGCAGRVAVDLLLLPAGTMLRRAGAGWPGRADLQARYPVLTGKEAAQAIRAAPPGARSGLVPAADDSGCYLVVLITTPGPAATDPAAAEQVLAAHINDMAKHQHQVTAARSVPVDPPPMFTLPGQLPRPEPQPDRSPAAPDGPDTSPGSHGAAA
jgi:hypothetical protein